MDYLLPKDYRIDETHLVELGLSQEDGFETYRVKDNRNRKYFLRVVRSTTEALVVAFQHEKSVLSTLNHPNIIAFIKEGAVTVEGETYAYDLFKYVSGQPLFKAVQQRRLSFNESLNITLSIANGVQYLHKQTPEITHNKITPWSVLLHTVGAIDIPIVSNFTRASVDGNPGSYMTDSSEYFAGNENETLFYRAPESFSAHYSPKSDQYAIGALFYLLLEYEAPWSVANPTIESVMAERNRELAFKHTTLVDIQAIIRKALSPEPDDRFESLSHFIAAIHNRSEKRCVLASHYDGISDDAENKFRSTVPVKSSSDAKLTGFDAIAGMDALKETIRVDIIDAINNKERYREYELTIPNGMLLYGPPGCGKTFFAEKMAEEIGFEFFSIKPSDIQSKWVNESQENIKQLFNKAREKAPSLVFIDELDAIAPSRDDVSVSHMNTSVVNEILAQLNNSGEDNVFVVGATNRYDAIDRALLRKGRLDKHIYVPPPDYEARKGMFKLYLERRPLSDDINYDVLAQASDEMVSSELKFICDEAARAALQRDQKITQAIVLIAIAENRS